MKRESTAVGSRRSPAWAAITSILLLSALAAFAGENWPQFRGPQGQGVASGEGLPDRWTVSENVRWKTAIPGRGWSSPITWGKKVFVTSAISAGAFKEPSTGIFGNDYIAELQRQGLSMDEIMKRVRARDIESTDEVAQEIRWMLYCLDADSGKILWEKEALRGRPFGGRHRKNTYASETPVTDGRRVYAYFGNAGLYCYSMEGEFLWAHRFDPRPIYLDFGTAASPVVLDDRVYVQNDNEQESYIAALDAKTGEELWTVRRSGTGRSSGWSSPYAWKNRLRTEIVAVGHGMALSYDTDGKELWRLKGLSGQPTPTPLSAGDLLYIGTGAQTGNNRPLFAVRPGGSGDISLKPEETASDVVAWFQKSASAYVPSPVVYRDRMYVVFDNGIFSSYDAKTGEQIYKTRIGEGGNTFSSSPWAYGGKIFCLSEDGDTFVIEAGDTFRLLGKNSLEEMCLATPAVADGSLFIRTATQLYCIRNQESAR